MFQKNYIFYECSKKRNGCKGWIKYGIKEKKYYILNICLNNVKHDTCTFENFFSLFQNNNLTNVNINLIKMQKFYVRALLKSGQTNNIANIKTNFKAKF